MKKRILSLALALTLLFAFVPTALAAELPDDHWEIDWLGATISTTVQTPHDYLGNVQIDGIYYWTGEPCNWNYSVYVVEDSVTELVLNSYVVEKETDFVTYSDGSSPSFVWREGEMVMSDPSLDSGQNFSHATEDTPFVSTFYKTQGCWFPQRFAYSLYDASLNEDMDYDEVESRYLGWIGFGAIIFTQSEIEEFEATGKLPPLTVAPDGEDFSQYVDLSKLVALLNGETDEDEQPAAPQPQTVKPTRSTVYVNDEETAFEAYNILGNNFFKLRDLAFALNGTDKQFSIDYDEETKAITLTSGEAYTPVGGEMTQGDGEEKTATPTASTIYLDGVELDLTVYLINGNNFFKLRDLMKALDVFVGYDEATLAITLDTSEGYID